MEKFKAKIVEVVCQYIKSAIEEVSVDDIVEDCLSQFEMEDKDTLDGERPLRDTIETELANAHAAIEDLLGSSPVCAGCGKVDCQCQFNIWNATQDAQEIAAVGNQNAEVESGLLYQSRLVRAHPSPRMRARFEEVSSFHALVADVCCGSIKKVEDVPKWIDETL